MINLTIFVLASTAVILILMAIIEALKENSGV